jgi:hypothetical protein
MARRPESRLYKAGVGAPVRSARVWKREVARCSRYARYKLGRMSGSERSAKLSDFEGSLLVRYEREAVVRRLEAEVKGEGKNDDIHFRKCYNHMSWCSKYKQVTLSRGPSQRLPLASDMLSMCAPARLQRSPLAMLVRQYSTVEYLTMQTIPRPLN